MHANHNRQLVFAALCTALGIVLPIVLHVIPNAGNTLLPMHIPVLLCGFLCAWPYALLCGIATPVLSCLLTSMPTFVDLPAMTVELALYGIVPALILPLLPIQKRFAPQSAQKPSTPKQAAHIYAALIAAMISGRLAYGLVNAFIFKTGAYSFRIWMTASFVTALPGILAQLALIPLLVMALQKIGIARDSN